MQETENFRKYLNSMLEINDEQWSKINSLIEKRRYKRKTPFLKGGTHCRWVGFVIKGCFRAVKDTEEKEMTFDFALENEFIGDYNSIRNNKPSNFNIIAIEDSTVACMRPKELFHLFNTSMIWQKFGRLVAEQTCCYFQERLLSFFFDSPQTRYEKLLTDDPEVILRIPQYMVANYLGVTKETLSRIRHKVSQ